MSPDAADCMHAGERHENLMEKNVGIDLKVDVRLVSSLVLVLERWQWSVKSHKPTPFLF